MLKILLTIISAIIISLLFIKNKSERSPEESQNIYESKEVLEPLANKFKALEVKLQDKQEKNIEKNLQKKSSEPDEILDIVDSLFYDTEDAILFLENNGDLKNKKNVEKYLSELERKKIEKNKPDGEFEKSIEEIYALAKKDLWDEAFNLSDKLEKDENLIRNNLLLIAISLGSDLEVIKRIFEKPFTIRKDIVNILSIKDQVEVLIFIYQYGANINYIDQQGRSTVVNSAMNGADKMLTWLLEQGVSANHYGTGFDALLFSLSQNELPKKIKMIKALLNHGANVGISHNQRVQTIQLENYPHYKILIDEFPIFSQ